MTPEFRLIPWLKNALTLSCGEKEPRQRTVCFVFLKDTSTVPSGDKSHSVLFDQGFIANLSRC